MRRVLVLLKRSAYDLYVGRHQNLALGSPQNKVIGNLLDRHRVHESTVEKCKDVLNRMSSLVKWHSLPRDELHTQIKDVDLVVTVGGDGTLLQASHYLDHSIPVLGVNSDPTLPDEVEKQREGEFDATRSRGYLCAATGENFEQVLHDILNGNRQPRKLQRLSTRIDGELLPTPALNDVLIAHPNPAAVSRFTFSINKGEKQGTVVHSRSSGVRVCTAAGSTAATLSAGGFQMPLECTDLQYMVREPIVRNPGQKRLMHGLVRKDEVLQVTWGSMQGCMYFDGAHLSLPLKFAALIEVSSSGPPLQVFR